MPLSYCGVGLPLSTPDLQAWLDRLLPPDKAAEWSGWHFDGFFGKGSRPGPEWPRQPPIKLGLLRWPTGASRPAFFHAVIGESTLDRIQTALGSNKFGPLVLDSGNGAVTATMYPLPARPLAQAALTGKDGEDLFLLTLVDQRFYLSFKETWIGTPPGSWASLIGMLGATAGAVNAAYLTPTRRWVGQLPIPATLDAAARMVGQRVVANLDGSLKTVNYTDAESASDVQYAKYSITAGGQFDDADIAPTVPSSLTVQFPVDDETRASWYQPYTVTVTLASLNLPGYGTATGVPGFTANVTGDQPYTTFNAAALSTLATQAAKDWYGWRLADLDVTLPLIRPWAPTGWEDSVEWFYGLAADGEPLATTTIRRGAWDEYKAADPDPPRPPVLTVRCTDNNQADGTLVGSECYPAVVVVTGAQASNYPDGTPVWLTILGGTSDGTTTVAQAPVKGGVYDGTEAGLLTLRGGDTRPRVFSTCSVCGQLQPSSSSSSSQSSASASSASSMSQPSISQSQSGGPCCMEAVTDISPTVNFNPMTCSLAITFTITYTTWCFVNGCPVVSGTRTVTR